MGGVQGNVFLGWGVLNASPLPGWKVVATGDFNGDGQPDLVWQNEATNSLNTMRERHSAIHGLPATATCRFGTAGKRPKVSGYVMASSSVHPKIA